MSWKDRMIMRIMGNKVVIKVLSMPIVLKVLMWLAQVFVSATSVFRRRKVAAD
jgi:hypothetical protein